jgi:TatD DNase family protein
MLIDTHAHVNFNAYKDDADEVIQRALENNVWMINVGSQFDTSQRAVKMVEQYKEGVYAAVALHPIHLGPPKFIDEEETGGPLLKFKTREEKFDREKYRELAKNPKVVAIGETGLDYYYAEDEKIKELQKQAFIQHLDLAHELNKPVILHCRKAYQDLLDELNAKPCTLKAVCHCFMGKWSQAEEFLKMGFYLGFNGLITYCRDYDKVIKNTPLERILIETDCPYLTPEPYRGERNEPLYVKYIAGKIAEIKQISFEKVAEQTTENARELFKF